MSNEATKIADEKYDKISRKGLRGKKVAFPVINTEIPATIRGILFMPEMIMAIAAGWKTQTRRLAGLEQINKNPGQWELIRTEKMPDGLAIAAVFKNNKDQQVTVKCPIGKPGDILWVREEHYRYGYWIKSGKTEKGNQKYIFKAANNDVKYTDNAPEKFCKSRCKINYEIPTWYKRNSRFMPKALCRTFLRIKNIWPERLFEITSSDAIAEGIYRWKNISEFCNYAKTIKGEEGIINVKIFSEKTANHPKELPVYKQYIHDIFVPDEYAITYDAKASFIGLFLSVHPQRHMNIHDPSNNVWLWAVEFEKTTSF